LEGAKIDNAGSGKNCCVRNIFRAKKGDQSQSQKAKTSGIDEF